MKLRYAPSTKSDLIWFRRYYSKAFPEGKINASKQYIRSVNLIVENPEIGREMEGLNTRLFQIARTPFSIIYQIRVSEIIIHRIYDQRSETFFEGDA